MAARFPSDVSVPFFQASWQDGLDQGAFYLPYYYPWGSWGGYSGYGYYPNFNSSNVTCYEAIPGSSRGSSAIQNQFVVAMLKFLYLLLLLR